MRTFFLALKRLLRSVSFPLFCFLIFAAVLGSAFLGDADRMAPAGICSLDDSALSRSVVDRLTAEGFLLYDTEADLRKAAARGEIDAGVILPDGFGQASLHGNSDGAAVFLEAEDAFVPTLYRNQASAAIFAEKAPYLTASALESAGAEIPREEVFSEYRRMMEGGALFSFESVWRGEFPTGEEGSLSYILGVLSVLLFAGIFVGVVRFSSPKETEPVRRIGAGRAFLTLTLPGLFWETAGFFLSALAAGAVAALLGRPLLLSLAGPALVYLLLSAGLSAILQTVLRRTEWAYGFLFVTVLLSLLLLPLWADAALLFPVLGKLRPALPTYWLWLCLSHPWPALAAAVLLLAAGCAALVYELKRRALKD